MTEYWPLSNIAFRNERPPEKNRGRLWVFTSDNSFPSINIFQYLPSYKLYWFGLAKFERIFINLFYCSRVETTEGKFIILVYCCCFPHQNPGVQLHTFALTRLLCFTIYVPFLLGKIFFARLTSEGQTNTLSQTELLRHNNTNRQIVVD